jgi:hypothetical protein
MSAFRGILTGFGIAAIKNKEAKDNAKMEIVKSAGVDYYTNQLPEHKKRETNRALAYNQLSSIFDSEQAADYFDANGFITGDGKDVERIQAMLKDKGIKPNAFKDYVPTENYSDRYNQRQEDFKTRFDFVNKNLTMQQGGMGESTVKGLLAEPAGAITRTEEVTTPAVEPKDVGPAEKGFMTEGTPERTETITTEIPRTTADSPMSEFFVSKTGVLDLGKTSEIEAAASNFRGFDEGMSQDQFGNVKLNIFGNKKIELAAFKSVMNDVAQQYETEDGKVSLSLSAEEANKKLRFQTQGVIGDNETAILNDYKETVVGGETTYTASGFRTENQFLDNFEGDNMQQKMYRYLSTLNSKSESQYFALSFPPGLKYPGTQIEIRKDLLDITR